MEDDMLKLQILLILEQLEFLSVRCLSLGV